MSTARVICSRCGSRAGAEEELCPGCEAPLARSGRPEWAAGMYERYFQLKEAADMVQSAAWPVNEFLVFLKTVEESLNDMADGVRALEVPVERVEDVADELRLGMEGIRLYQEGLSEMRAYGEDEDAQHLDDGLQRIVAGNERLIQALRLTRQRRRATDQTSGAPS
ncbi:MAG: hypothetical protein ACYCW6_18730 [Candidatus Xenobia bacterium]